MYNDMEYDVGLKLCTDLLAKCDKMLILSEMSKGVIVEFGYCIAARIPVDFLEVNYEI